MISLGIYPTCDPPAVEGQPYTFTWRSYRQTNGFQFRYYPQQSPKSYVWACTYYRYTQDNTWRIDCTKYRDQGYVGSVKDVGNGGRDISLTIDRVDKDFDGTRWKVWYWNDWTNQYYIDKVCVLQVYAYKNDPTCSPLRLTQTGTPHNNAQVMVSWMCSISNVFPEPSCRFEYHSQAKVQNVPDQYVTQTTTYSNDRKYFSGKCNMTLPVSMLKPETYKFRVTAYPSARTHSGMFEKRVDAQPLQLDVSALTCNKPVLVNNNADLKMECSITTPYYGISCGLQYSKEHNNIFQDYDQNVSWDEPQTSCSGTDLRCINNCSVKIDIASLDAAVYRFRVVAKVTKPVGQEELILGTSNPTDSISFYPPEITMFSVDSKQGQRVEVTSGNDVMFSCRAKGNPTPELTIRKRSSPMRRHLVPDYQSPTSSELSEMSAFEMMQCRDSGHYSCSGSNSLGVTDEKVISVLVRCSPELSSPDAPIQNQTVTLDSPLTIEIPITGFPTPKEYILSRKVPGGGIDHNGTSSSVTHKTMPEQGLGLGGTVRVRDNKRSVPYNATYEKDSLTNGTVVLTVSGFRVEDSGDYTLHIRNGIGEGLVQTFSITVTSDKPPSPPGPYSVDTGEDNTNLYTIVGSCVAALILVLIIVFVIIIFIRKGKRSNRSSWKENNRKLDAGSQPPEGSNDFVQQDCQDYGMNREGSGVKLADEMPYETLNEGQISMANVAGKPTAKRPSNDMTAVYSNDDVISGDGEGAHVVMQGPDGQESVSDNPYGEAMM